MQLRYLPQFLFLGATALAILLSSSCTSTLSKSKQLNVPGSLVAITSMHHSRRAHKSVRLNNGTVLIWGGAEIDDYELYDPGSRQFTVISHGKPQLAFDAERNVIIAGKYKVSLSSPNPDLAYLLVDSNKLLVPRDYFTAVLLRSGQVLVAAGSAYEFHEGDVDKLSGKHKPDSRQVYLASAELYDPITAKSKPTGSMSFPQDRSATTLLDNGSVLFSGGFDESAGVHQLTNKTEVYEPISGQFHAGPSMHYPRLAATATLLKDGTILIAGGSAGALQVLNSAEILDIEHRSCITVANMHLSRSWHTATLLPDGAVLICGGDATPNASVPHITSSVEVYHPSTRNFSEIEHMTTSRAAHNAISLDRFILITGGDWESEDPLHFSTWDSKPIVLSSAELFVL